MKIGKRYTQYAFRHTWITRKLKAGVDSHVVATLAGHKDTNMIHKVYSDTLGLLIAVLITGANIDDGTAAPTLLAQVSPTESSRLQTIFGDNKYHNKGLAAWLEKERSDWNVEVKSRPKESKGFVPVEKRWAVERSNAWHGRCRRNSKDYERRPDSSAAMIQISHIHVMLRRLAPTESPPFNDRSTTKTQKNTNIVSG